VVIALAMCTQKLVSCKGKPVPLEDEEEKIEGEGKGGGLLWWFCIFTGRRLPNDNYL
jgi:hypothetical protein